MFPDPILAVKKLPGFKAFR